MKQIRKNRKRQIERIFENGHSCTYHAYINQFEPKPSGVANARRALIEFSASLYHMGDGIYHVAVSDHLFYEFRSVTVI